MAVQSIATGDELFEVTGVGYAPEGAFLLDGAEVAPGDHPQLCEMVRCALLCCDAEVRRVDDEWRVDGDPTEGALVTVAMKAGLDPAAEGRACPRRDVIPFESEHRFMATLHHDPEGAARICVKGAPERILGMCRRQRSAGGSEPLDPDHWRRAHGRDRRARPARARPRAAGDRSRAGRAARRRRRGRPDPARAVRPRRSAARGGDRRGPAAAARPASGSR